ncbi:MAG: DUF1192 domain-containing protein [Parvularculaceae bacterium]
MDEDAPRERPDFELAFLVKQDLSTLSIDDLRARIDSMKAEIARCEAAIAARGDTRAAAEEIFKI